jgi:hypothetical protein
MLNLSSSLFDVGFVLAASRKKYATGKALVASRLLFKQTIHTTQSPMLMLKPFDTKGKALFSQFVLRWKKLNLDLFM